MIRISDFKMMIPKLDERKTPPNVAIEAVNCTVETGVLKPLADLAMVQAIPKPGDIRSIYKCGDTWLGFTGDVSFVRAPSSHNRVYYLGDGYPKHTDENLCHAGGVPSLYPSTTYRMGVKRPSAALSAGLSKFDSMKDYGKIIGTVSYVYTYVHWIDAEYAEESAPSPPTVPVPVRINEQVTLTGFVHSAEAGVNNLYYRVYRSLGGSEFEAVPVGRDGNGDFLFDMPVSQQSFVDMDQQTGEVYQNVNVVCGVLGWDSLPDSAANLCQFQNGIFAATYGKKVLLSELFVPYAFPQGVSSSKDYTYEFPSDPVRIASYRDMLIVGLHGKPWVLMGSDPSAMQVQEIPFNHACVGDMCVTEVGVFYPSPTGLVLCDGVTAKPVTEDTYTIDQWRALGPENLKMFYHNDKLIGIFAGSSSGFVFDFKRDKSVVNLDFGTMIVHGGFKVPGEDKLYLLMQSGEVYSVFEWGAGSLMTMSFTGRVELGDRPVFDAVRVVGEYSPDTYANLILEVDGELTAYTGLTDDPLWTGLRVWGRVLEYTVIGTAGIREIRLGGILSELL